MPLPTVRREYGQGRRMTGSAGGCPAASWMKSGPAAPAVSVKR